MAKKDFTQMNTGRVSGVAGNIRQATSRKGVQTPANAEEAAARAEQGKTQGRKGCMAARINLAFTPANYEFVKIMASMTGKTMTEFVNLALETYRKDHSEIYERAREIAAAVALTEPKDE